jgi:hypothetical protein
MFVSAPVLRSSVDQVLVKLDHQAGSKDTFSGHYALLDGDHFDPINSLFAFTNLPGYGINTPRRAHNLGFRWSHLFHPRLIHEFRFGFNDSRQEDLQESAGTSRSQELGFPDVLTEPGDLGFPNIALAGFDGIGEPVFTPRGRSANTFQLSNNLAWSPEIHSGRHQLKFGFDVRHLRNQDFFDFFARGLWSFLGVFTGDPLGDLLRGLPAFAIGAEGSTFREHQATALSSYVQDDIRISGSLTMNLGMRYEYNQPPVERQDRMSVPDLSSASVSCSPIPDCQFLRVGTNGISRGIYEADTNNLAPRIGFAWRPLARNRFVVRAAYGIFHDTSPLTPTIVHRINPPFYKILLFPNNGTYTIQDIMNQGGFSTVSNMVPGDFQDGYMQQWNLDIQQELHHQIVIDVSYVGSKGTGLGAVRDINQIDPQTGLRPFPQFGSTAAGESRASSSYHALQFRTERRMSDGLGFLVAYTWSKSIDDASSFVSTRTEPALAQDSANLEAERGLSSFHAKHRFVVNYFYELPFGRGRKWLNQDGVGSALLSRWQLAGIVTFQSGRPFTVNRGIDQSGSGTSNIIPVDRPDQVADPFHAGPVPTHPDPACHTTQSDGGRAADQVRVPDSWFNPCAFAPAPGAFGNAGRNTGALLSSNAFGNRPPRQIQLGIQYIF